MDCARVDEELVGFELGALDGATRAAVEAHLTGCARCVSAFLALKRAIDAGEDAVAPSETTRARVRAEAARLLTADSSQPTVAERKRPERRAPWAIAMAAAAAVIAPFAWQALHATRTPAVHDAAKEAPAPGVVPVKLDETIDTARTTPENLAFL